jgi:hypothetical protein
MADYRYLFYDYSTRALIDALPMTGVQFGWEVSGVGTLTGSIPLYADDLPASRVRDAILPYRTKVFVERDHQLCWGGWINEEPSYDSSTGVVTISAEESLGYFSQRYLPTVSFTGQDQLAIARALIDDLQAQPGGDMWINTDPAAISTVLRDRSYSQYDLTPGLTALSQLSEVINGFEYITQVTYDGNQMPYELLILGYPQVGRRLEASGLVLEYDRFTGAGNVESFTWADPGTQMATRIWANTETDEGVQLTAKADRPDLIAFGYPLMEQAEIFDGVTNIQTLQDHADAIQTFRGTPRIAATVTVKDQPSMHLQDFIVGDDILVRLSDWRFPPGQGGAPGLVTYLRIVGCTVTPGVEGEETYQFTMAEFANPL